MDHPGPDELKRALHSALAALERNYDILDSLNVFPVPDGDTGTNMLSTFEAGVRVLNNPVLRTMDEMAEQMNREMIRESRGNSGFITARFFHGFFESAGRGKERLGPRELAAGFAGGLFQVNRSLFSPAEGTMVTIIRVMAESMQADRGEAEGPGRTTVTGMLEAALEAAGVALFDTPRLLPLLARAGVIDSGALGFIILMKGFLKGLKPPSADHPAAPPERENEADYRFPPRSTGPENGAAGGPAAEEMFGYCTEVNVRTPRGFSLPELSTYLGERGGSIALVHEDNFLKVHIHTDDPAEIITRLKGIGTVEHVKIDNMREQVSRFSANRPDAGAGDGEGGDAAGAGECAVLAFAPGEGFREVFSTLEVDHCLVYGEKLPTAGDIIAYLEGIPESGIIVLPNNGNILPALTAAGEKSGKHLEVLHSTDIVRGIAAAYGYSRNDGLKENSANMRECMEMARGIFVYRCGADSGFDGRSIGEGDYFAVMDGAISASGPDLIRILSDCVAAGGEAANITLYYGSEALLPDLTAFRDTFASEHGDVEMELIHGGQSRETIIISME